MGELQRLRRIYSMDMWKLFSLSMVCWYIVGWLYIAWIDNYHSIDYSAVANNAPTDQYVLVQLAALIGLVSFIWLFARLLELSVKRVWGAE